MASQKKARPFFFCIDSFTSRQRIIGNFVHTPVLLIISLFINKLYPHEGKKLLGKVCEEKDACPQDGLKTQNCSGRIHAPRRALSPPQRKKDIIEK